MFDRIARIYDPMNTAMSAGLHHRWRGRAADLAGVSAGARVLDVATGTGDLAIELAGRVWPGGEVVGVDFSEGMLDRARAKTAARGVAGGHEPPRVMPRFEWADAMALPYPDDRFDAATVGFGARNFEDLGRGLAEMARVVRPGGRVVVLEMTTPKRPPLSLFYRVWFDRVVPALGLLAGALLRAGSRGRQRGQEIGEAYSYLPNSVKRFPAPNELAEQMALAGVTGIAYVLLAGGIIAIHAGTVAAGAGP
jgi:demethylmenaquinone methyltransferase/2-methoxy-6-polyprenyl-1,4-benzoquinol methylase